MLKISFLVTIYFLFTNVFALAPNGLDYKSSFIDLNKKFPFLIYQERLKIAEAILKKAFEDGREVLISVSGKEVNSKLLAFDWDGVITEEKGYLEIAWTVMYMQIVAEINDIDLYNIPKQYYDEGKKFRKSTKGQEHGERIQSLIDASIKNGRDINTFKLLDDYKDDFWKVINRLAVNDYQGDYNSWVYEASKQFIDSIKEKSELPLYVITANPQDMFREFVKNFDIRKHFIEIFGHPFITKKDESKRTKTTILLDLLEQYALQKNEIVFFGDSKSDIKFGNTAGVVTFAVANNFENSLKLLDESPDLIATSLKLQDEIFKILRLKNTQLDLKKLENVSTISLNTLKSSA